MGACVPILPLTELTLLNLFDLLECLLKRLLSNHAINFSNLFCNTAFLNQNFMVTWFINSNIERRAEFSDSYQFRKISKATNVMDII